MGLAGGQRSSNQRDRKVTQPGQQEGPKDKQSPQSPERPSSQELFCEPQRSWGRTEIHSPPSGASHQKHWKRECSHLHLKSLCPLRSGLQTSVCMRITTMGLFQRAQLSKSRAETQEPDILKGTPHSQKLSCGEKVFKWQKAGNREIISRV